MNWKSELNEEQLAAVTHQEAPLLVLAGAGSGKTRVLTYRTHYLIEEGIAKPEEIVLLTFTNKAAEEMKERVAKMGKEGRNLGFAGTFHTFCARILRRDGYAIGLKPNFTIYDTSDQEGAYRLAIANQGLEAKNNKPGLFLHLVSRMKNELITPEIFETTVRDEFQAKVLAVWRSYEKILKEAGAVDFDDLLLKTVLLLRKPSIREELTNKYKFILIDEYQDTNKVQFELTKLLAADPNNLTVVGDAAQAIYSFRGADFRNLNLLKEEYPNLVTIQLPKNYRSSQTILDAAYGVIVNNTNHPVIKLEAINDKGEAVDFLETLDEKEEATYVTGVANRRIDKGGNLAVLYRTNAQSRALEEALIRRGIEYKLVGGVRFYDRMEIKDLLAYLRTIANENDLVSWKRIENLGKRNASKFKEWSNEKRDELIKGKPAELLKILMEQTNYISRFNEKDEEDIARLENIQELLAVASEEEELATFLEKIALIQSEELADRKMGAAKVTLMTIHAAKGLEFDEVVITGMEEGMLPHSRSLMEKDDLEEERRLLYVAMTRAKEKLHLTMARFRLVYGGRHNTTPSRFLAEIPEGLIKVGSQETKFRETVTRTWDEDGRRIVDDWETEGMKIKPSKSQVAAACEDDFADIDAW